ncbi:MAG: DUF935 family protein [Desulfobacterales bacterium]|nr:DUF935 family protein [Desulfobacterales bacterium]
MPILDQFGREIKQRKTPEQDSLPAAVMYGTDRDYVTSGLTPEALASMLRQADAGDMAQQAELFDQIHEKDGHLQGEISKRHNVILDADFTLTPTDDSARAQQVADFVQENVFDRTDWEDTLVTLQEAVGNGFSAVEVQWDVSSGMAIPTEFEFVQRKRFIFTDTRGYVTQIPRLISDEELMGGEIPPWKLMMHVYGGKSGNATRSGIYRVCSWMWLIKNYSIKDWIIFAEVYGMPLRIGKYDPGASKDDKSALINAIRSIGTDAAGVISKATEIEFIETNRGKDTGELYRQLAAFGNKEMSKAILGGTLTADIGDKGSYAAANVHNDVRTDLIRADARAIAATVRHQLIRPVVGFNFGWDTDVPLFSAKWTEPEDFVAKAEYLDKVTAKVSVPARWYREQFQIPEPEKGEEVVGGPPQAVPPPVSAKHRPVISRRGSDGKSLYAAADANDDKDIADIYADRLGDAAANAGEKLLEPIRQLVANANSLAEIRDGLFELYPNMDAQAFSDVMAEAMLAAQLAGRYEVMQNVD